MLSSFFCSSGDDASNSIVLAMSTRYKFIWGEPFLPDRPTPVLSTIQENNRSSPVVAHNTVVLFWSELLLKFRVVVESQSSDTTFRMSYSRRISKLLP
jgi:hypothetical protein